MEGAGKEVLRKEERTPIEEGKSRRKEKMTAQGEKREENGT